MHGRDHGSVAMVDRWDVLPTPVGTQSQKHGRMSRDERPMHREALQGETTEGCGPLGISSSGPDLCRCPGWQSSQGFRCPRCQPIHFHRVLPDHFARITSLTPTGARNPEGTRPCRAVLAASHACARPTTTATPHGVAYRRFRTRLGRTRAKVAQRSPDEQPGTGLRRDVRRLGRTRGRSARRGRR